MTREVEADTVAPETKLPRLLKYRPLLRLKSLQVTLANVIAGLPKYFVAKQELTSALSQLRPSCSGCGTCLDTAHPAVNFYREPSRLLGPGGRPQPKSDGPIVVGCRWCHAELKTAGHAPITRSELSAIYEAAKDPVKAPEKAPALRVVK